jgi:hypothetical protein
MVYVENNFNQTNYHSNMSYIPDFLWTTTRHFKHINVSAYFSGVASS